MKALKLTGMLVVSGFHLVVGVVMLIILVLSGGTLIHVGVLGLLSIVVSYGLSKMKRWAFYPLIILFFGGITFGVITIYSTLKLFDSSLITLSFEALMFLYLVLLVISFLNVLSNREKFE